MYSTEGALNMTQRVVLSVLMITTFSVGVLASTWQGYEEQINATKENMEFRKQFVEDVILGK